MKKRIFIVAAVITGSQLYAQLPATDSANLFTTFTPLDPVVITANRFAQKSSQTGKVITVIGTEQMQKNQGRSIGEILNDVAGVTINGANNNTGTNLTVSMRGASAGNVLVLIDGVPVSDPSTITNYFDLNFIDVSQIERIEILKGGQSTLYGSDAVAGVINIITKKNQRRFSYYAGLSGGSYHTLRENAGINGIGRAVGWSMNYSHLSSGGFSTAYDSTGKGNFDKDATDQHNTSVKIQTALSKTWTAQVFGDYSFYKTGLDAAAFIDDGDFTVKNYNIRTGVGFTKKGPKQDWHFNYVFDYVTRDYVDDSIFKSNPYVSYSKSFYLGRSHFAELYGTHTWDRITLLAGIDQRVNNTTQDYFSTGPFGPYTQPTLHASMSQLSPYTLLTFHDGEGLRAEIGGRWNIHSVYGSNFSYSFNPSYTIGKARLFANLYSAFKTPTLYQLYDPYAGNKNLNPEKSKVMEVGASFDVNKKFWIRGVGFWRNTHDAINFILVDPINFQSQYTNVSRQKNDGFELEAKYQAGKLGISADYAFTEGETFSAYDATGAPLSKDTSYNNLYHVPKHAVHARVGYQVSKQFYASAQGRYVGKKYEAVYGAAPIVLPSYLVIDLYAEYKFDRRLLFFTDLKNITDKKYFDIAGYNSKRMNFVVGVRVEM